MESKRLIVVSPRFWPLSGGRELLATRFVECLAEMGHRVTVLTWRVSRIWPERFHMGDISVVRLPQRREGLLKSIRRMTRRRSTASEDLFHWLEHNRNQFDFGIVISAPSESAAIADCFTGNRLPVVVRCESSEDFTGQVPDHPGPAGQVCCVHPEGGSREGDVIIPDGLAEPEFLLSRQQIRQSLNEAHPLFELNDGAPLAICCAPLVRNSGVFELVRAWRTLMSRFPDARLWLLGKGDDGFELFQRIRELELENAVILPGDFDDIHDVLRAADAMILPGRTMVLDWCLRTAMLLGVPVLYPSETRHLFSGWAGLSAHDHPAQPGDCGKTGSRTDPVEFPGWSFDESGRTLESVLLQWANSAKLSIDAELNGTGDRDRMETNSPSGHYSIHSMARRYVVTGMSLLAAES